MPGPAANANADKALRRQRTNEYPIEIWYFLACFISLVAVVQLASRIYSRVFRKQAALPSDSDSQRSLRLTRIPIGILNAYRIAWFRTSFHIDMLGSPYTLNLAEVFVTLAYIAAIYTWALINSEYHKFDLP